MHCKHTRILSLLTRPQDYMQRPRFAFGTAQNKEKSPRRQAGAQTPKSYINQGPFPGVCPLLALPRPLLDAVEQGTRQACAVQGPHVLSYNSSSRNGHMRYRPRQLQRLRQGVADTVEDPDTCREFWAAASTFVTLSSHAGALIPHAVGGVAHRICSSSALIIFCHQDRSQLTQSKAVVRRVISRTDIMSGE